VILSIHVPKAAGNSFRALMHGEFGDRLMLDYGDWAGFDVPEANARRAIRTQEMRSRRDELLQNYDAIHGHFIADKYARAISDRGFRRILSATPINRPYRITGFSCVIPQREHPEEKLLHDAKMTLHDYLAWDAFRNQQSQYLGSVSIDDFAMVGLSEEFYRSVDLFNSIFGCNLRGHSFLNVNPDHQGRTYAIDHDVRKAVEKYRPADVELYRRAKEIFARQTRQATVLWSTSHGA
jgi:hypothetical protein